MSVHIEHTDQSHTDMGNSRKSAVTLERCTQRAKMMTQIRFHWFWISCSKTLCHFFLRRDLLKSNFQRVSCFSTFILNYGLLHWCNKRKWRSFRHKVETAGTSPVKFDHSFKVIHSLPPAPERHVDQTTVQERAQVFCTVIDENYNTHIYR